MSYQFSSSLEQLHMKQGTQLIDQMKRQLLINCLHDKLEELGDESIGSELPSFKQMEQEYIAGQQPFPMLRSNVTYRELTPEEKERFIKLLKDD